MTNDTPEEPEEEEEWIPCSNLRVGDCIPGIGRITAVSEPDGDGYFDVRGTDAGTTSLNWYGFVVR